MKSFLVAYSRIVAAKEQVSADLGGEVAILHLKTGIYYGLNEIGAHIWNLVQEPRTFSELRDVFLNTYEVESEYCERDLKTFLEGLASEGLIEVHRQKAA